MLSGDNSFHMALIQHHQLSFLNGVVLLPSFFQFHTGINGWIFLVQSWLTHPIDTDIHMVIAVTGNS